MLTQCSDCHRIYEDEFRVRLCPHDPIDAGYCTIHDLYACKFHDPAKVIERLNKYNEFSN